MKWFGNDDIVAEEELKSTAKETALKSKDTVLRPSVKHNQHFQMDKSNFSVYCCQRAILQILGL